MARWTLEDLIDFEQALASGAKAPSRMDASIKGAVKVLEGPFARRMGMALWLEGVRDVRILSAGRKFSSALASVGFLLAILAFGAGISGVLGLVDRSRGGMDVVLFLAILLGIQWLSLLFAILAWLYRRRTGEAFTSLQRIVGKVARRFAGETEDGWWHRITDGGGAPRSALLWRLAKLVQGAGVCFNLGILCGLAGLVFVRNLGFFWESTTEEAMRNALGNIVGILSAPWASFWPAAAPDAAVIDSTRWLPQQGGMLAPGPSAWWLFLLMAVFIWGLIPRFILWLLAGKASGRALGRLDFQARHHRVLWRELIGVDRIEADEKPLDGVLVLDVGGSGLKPESLRPFLLQKLRVHPSSWHTTAVLDPGAENQAAAALGQAPAGVVLVAEGWALSPPRMKELHGRIRAAAGAEAPLKFLIANEAGASPAFVTEDEKQQWERFVDALRDPFAEVYFYES